MVPGSSTVVEYSEVLKEELRLRALKSMVDKVCMDIVNGKLCRDEADCMVSRVREKARFLIPDMMNTYDMIYGSRFRRLIQQFILAKNG